MYHESSIKSLFANKSVIQKNLQFLNDKNSFKFICGASLTDTEKIKDLATIFSLSGTNIIDISPESTVIEAAMSGINIATEYSNNEPDKYPYYNEPVLMVSINAGEDPHFKTASINLDLCDQCKLCINVCEFKAISFAEDINNIRLDKNVCYGCNKCILICPKKAIILEQNTIDLSDILTKLIDNYITGIEIHVGSCTKETLTEFREKIIGILGSDFINEILISYSLESSLYSTKEFINYAQHIVAISDTKPIIQVDGTPMSGNISTASSLQSLAAAQVLINSNVDAYIILAGGINHLTKTYSKLFNIDCNGIAMGTYARKLLWPYLDLLDKETVFNKSISIATHLAHGLEF